MIGRLLLSAVAAVLLASHCHGSEGLRARIANYDWSSLDATLTDDAGELHPEKDFKGIRRDTYYFLGYQVAAIGILYVMPEGISGWSEESKENYSFDQWKENITNPVWDKDDYFINYVLHPYWGAAYYVRSRERGFGRHQSFWYAALLSTLYEYGVEAMFEQPSLQDLVVTPLGGALLGEYLYRIRQDILRSHALGAPVTRKDRWLLALSDPLGTLNGKIDRLFGRDVQLSVRSFVSSSSVHRHKAFEADLAQHERDPHRAWSHDPVVGVTIKLEF